MIADDSGFRSRTIAIVLGVGIACALAFAVLTAFAADLRNGHDGGGHVLSIAGTGFSGVVALTTGMGMPTVVGRNEKLPPDVGLLVLTPSPATEPKQLEALVEARGDAAVLIVLPKWRTVPMKAHRGWIRQIGVLPSEAVVAPMARLAPIEVAPAKSPEVGARIMRDDIVLASAPAHLQVLTKGGLEPVLVNAAQEVVLGKLTGRPVFILADPDLLANHSLADSRRARAAVELLDYFAAIRGGKIVFDVSLNGLGVPRSLLRLAFTPPFLALTACLLAAALFAGVQAAVRFGSPIVTPRAIAFGKLALVDNAAALISRAGRQPGMATRYATLMRDAAAAAARAPAALTPAAIADWLDQRHGQKGAFADLAARAADAQDSASMLATAQALHLWKESRLHDSR